MPKIVFVGRMGWPVANTKTKREKTPKKTLKGHKNVKNTFSHSPREHIFKKLASWVENCDL